MAAGLHAGGCPYVGLRPIGEDVPWLQLVLPDQIAPSAEAVGQIHALGHRFRPVEAERLSDDQLLGLSISSPALLEQAIPFALEKGFDLMLLDASRGLGSPWAELSGEPDLTILRDAVTILRRLRREEQIDLIYFGGVRSGTDTAKVVALGGMAVILGVTLALAAGGEIKANHEMQFAADRSDTERAEAVANILQASAQEASMMARCTGKTNLHNVEPEDLRAISKATAEATGVPLAGTL